MSQLFFLYGPPASGKLIVGKLVAKATGCGLFDNTLTVNLGQRLFRFGSEPFVEICRDIRSLVFQRAVKEALPGLVFTFCYSHPRDDQFIERVEEIMNEGAWTIVYAYLYADQNILEQRVGAANRTALLKVDSIPRLRENLERSSYVLIPGRPSISVDTGVMHPAEACEEILAAARKNFQLSTFQSFNGSTGSTGSDQDN